MAQGYQESMLNQAARSPAERLESCRSNPRPRQRRPSAFPNVMTAENNIHAGVKVLRDIADKYFSDPKIDAAEPPAIHVRVI